MKTYNSAIIGCGKIGSGFDPNGVYKITTHAGAYKNIEKTNLVALCDSNEEELKVAGKKWGVSNLYLDYNEMLKKEKVDILSICTWSNTHYKILKNAIKYNLKAIFCEKPIATSLKEADEMIKLCKKNDIIFVVGHQRRYDPFHRMIKKFIEEGNIGEIQQASFYYSSGINNFGSHMFDLLRFFFGEPEFLQAHYKNNSVNDIDGIIKFKNGFIVTIQSLDSKYYPIFNFYIFGTKGALKINRLGLNLETYGIKKSNLLMGYKELFKTKTKIKRNRNENESPMVKAIENIIECIENKKTPISSGEDGREALSLICAFNESAMRNGKLIALPLKTSNIKIKSR